MARAGRTPASTSRTSKAITNARRMWPYMLMAWERWQSLSPEQKERYRRQAREYAERGRSLIDEHRRKRR